MNTNNIIGEFTQIPLKDLKPEDYEHHECLSSYDKTDEVRLYRGDVQVKGDLDLDEVDDDRPFYGIIIHGDLTVEGTIDNFNENAGIYLYVTGTTKAKNLLSSGGCIILNIAKIKYFTMGYYNDGMLVIKCLSTEVLYNRDHCNAISEYDYVGMSLDENGYGSSTTDINLNLSELCEYWYKNNKFTDCIEVETDFDDDDDDNDDIEQATYEYRLDDDIVKSEALNDNEQFMINELKEFAQVHKKRGEDLPAALVSSSMNVVWEGNKAVKISLNFSSDYEHIKACIERGKLEALRCLVIKQLVNCDDLHQEFQGIPSLEKLVIRDTWLESVPDWIRHCTNLSELDLGSNRIASFPNWVSSLKNLEKLVLKGNEIKCLPTGIGKLSSLKTLDVRRNTLLVPLLSPPLVKLVKSGVVRVDSDEVDSIPGHLEGWSLASNPFTEHCEQVINQYRKAYGSEFRSTPLSKEMWPPKSIAKVQQDNKCYMFTSGISNYCQSRKIGAAYDPRQFSRIELALCLKQELLTADLESELETYLLEIADIIINQEDISTPGGVVYVDCLQKYPGFDKVFGLVSAYNPPALPKIELPSVNDERANVLWLIPVTEKELEKPQSNFKKFIQKKYHKDPEYYIIGN